MYVSLRTTVFWNLSLLMVLAAALISFVVYRVMEKELLREGALSGGAVFAAVEAGAAHMLERDSGLLESPSEGSELQALFKRYIDAGACRELVLVDNENRVLAASQGGIGRKLFDGDIVRALETKALATRIENRFGAHGPRLVAAAPLRIAGKTVGVLKALLPLQDIHRSMKNAFAIIFLYIITSAVILIIVGFLLFSRYLVSPMQRLIGQTENIAQENVSGLPLFLSGGNELQKLSSALKSLADNLKTERERLRGQMEALAEKNAQLKLAQREIIQTEKLASVGRLAAGIAHEVGNPLGIILGYIHLLRSPDITEAERADYLNRMEHETERMKNTIGDVLDFSQPSSQEITHLQLNDIVHDTCAMIACHKEFKNILIVENPAGGLPAIRGNDRLLRQLLLNLALNACDAMAGAGGTLTITTTLDSDHKGSSICLVVADTGHGIAPEHQGKIFDPFFTTRAEGTGLGLANVHRIVEVMEGTIAFASQPGQGTAFTIHFPVAAPQ
ncbi:MAG: HAMP domain-containing protein [Deltaproteobacteria bacterium]|nr:HAMP domain-containing protein [Deltaproteobacteria bacterium]